MKILHITATHLKKYGGIPMVLENLVKHQNEIKDIHSIVLSIKNDVTNINSNFFYFYNEISMIKKFINDYNPDIIIFHGLYFIEYIKISKYLSVHKFKYFIEPHSSFMKSSQKKSKIKKSIANRTIFKSFLKSAYGYIFLNDIEKKNSIFSTENDVIIPNGINISNNELRKNVNDKIRLFFIGRIDVFHKGLDLLFEDLRKIDDMKRNFSIDLFGVGSQQEIQIIENYIMKFKNLEIKFKGSIYDKAKENVLRDYHIMILASRYEGFPMTILEALSYGNPCIVTDGTNVRQMIENNKLGWGTDYDKISATIIKAVDEYKMNYQFYINNTKKYVEQNFTWNSIALKSIEEISNILGGPEKN